MLTEAGLHYDLIGPRDGRVVCLVHSLAADTGMWREQMLPLLNAGHSVLRLDLPGHGGSVAHPGAYSMAGLAQDVVAVLDAAGVGIVDYVGLSLGGMVGQALALAHPARLRSVMICDALPQSLPNADTIWGPRIRQVRAARSCAPIAQATLERWLTAGFIAAHPTRSAEILATIAATHPDGYAGCAEAISGFDHVPRLPDITLPVAVVCGEHDHAVPPAEGQRIAALVRNGRFHLVPGAMHLPNVECPEFFNALLLDWLASTA